MVATSQTSSLPQFGHQLVYGAGVGVDLLILKVCRFELGYNETVCANLKDERFKDLEAQVQIDVNKFEVIRDWVYHAPPIFFAAIAGALSDRYGRKPLLVFPIVGKEAPFHRFRHVLVRSS